VSLRWKVAVGILLLTSAFYNIHQARADGVVNLHLGSKHINAQRDFNETNLGLGVAYNLGTNASLRGGFYNNSEDNTSVYMGGELHSNQSRMFTVGLQYGVVSGYSQIPLVFYVMPVISHRYKNVRTEIGYIPAIEQYPAVVTATMGVFF